MKQLTFLALTLALLLVAGMGPALAQTAASADTPQSATDSTQGLVNAAGAQPLSWSITGTFSEAMEQQLNSEGLYYSGYCYNDCSPCTSHLDCPAGGGFYYTCERIPLC